MAQIDSNALDVAAYLERVSGQLYDDIHHATEESAIDLRDAWRDNARETAGRHGKRYPNSIDYQMGVGLGEISAEIWPQGGPQSDMSFEMGSENQPAHRDGERALFTMKPLIERRLDIAIRGTFR